MEISFFVDCWCDFVVCGLCYVFFCWFYYCSSFVFCNIVSVFCEIVVYVGCEVVCVVYEWGKVIIVVRWVVNVIIIVCEIFGGCIVVVEYVSFVGYVLLCFLECSF